MAFLTAITTLLPAVAGVIGKIKENRDARKAAQAGTPGVPALPAAPTGLQTLPTVTQPTSALQTVGNIANLALNPSAAIGSYLGSAVGKQVAGVGTGLPDFLKAYALDASQLRSYLRAPKGYVIVHDASGQPFALLKKVAQMYHLWKPAAKPPISATDYKHFKRNKTIEKKLKRIAGPIYRKNTTRKCTPKKGR